MIADISQKDELELIEMENERFYKIKNVNDLPPFFMTIVSDSNHWMFISSNGGITAGRKDAEHALFPYYTDDKIRESTENTGSKTIVRFLTDDKVQVWEPFSERSEAVFNIQRNLYKNPSGNQIIFEEINLDLNVSFRYRWSSSNLYGFVRTCTLINNADTAINLQVLDGVQNILPYGVGSDLQRGTSNLADAYKRSELIPESGLGIFALSAIIVDKAEPSEALKANTVWSLGFDKPAHLLSSKQLKNFRVSGKVEPEADIKGDKASYFVVSDLMLKANEEKRWVVVANVNQTQSAIIQLSENIKNDKELYEKLVSDIKAGTDNLVKLVAAADGLQSTADGLTDSRHFSNVLFNIMRGGIFDDNYRIDKNDFSNYLRKANPELYGQISEAINKLPEIFLENELNELANGLNNSDFIRLAIEYLPLKFSRRHGDPSRPWNQFSINTRSEIDGAKILDYQGNWRDIFQNWEALAHAYPRFIEGMIYKFVNASTFDGYNPYRVTKGGFDWETIEPDNPWSYIGYWGDHQIIYLQKFLEFIENHQPGRIQELLHQDDFVYANVPYKIKSYAQIVKNPKDTIEFNEHADRAIHERMNRLGADGALLTDAKANIYHVSFCEKILATLLAKLSNFVPDGGIWMNTQRPEWNDANNALVGNGLSMVTLYYLRRFLKFFQPIFEKSNTDDFTVSAELQTFFISILESFNKRQNLLSENISDTDRKQMLDELGMAGSNYRSQIYSNGFSGSKAGITSAQLQTLFKVASAFLEHAIIVNERTDGLYHSYNLISFDDDKVKVSHLSEMLEGQVAVLSSGYLNAGQSLKVLDALKVSSLYREDQRSYILYPNKELPKFLEKNTIPDELAQTSTLLKKLVEDYNLAIVEKDVKGSLHFNGNFRNASNLIEALEQLGDNYKQLVESDKALVLQIFESVFKHKEFTGRSGTFFAYEGLGSIYWHMVSKLLLAVQETCIWAINDKADADVTGKLAAHYYEVQEGIGVHKPPQLYGAFPTDPYSHTPEGKGVQQPGMTGQVKEDILSRFGELGVFVNEGKLYFQPVLLRKDEFLVEDKMFEYINVASKSMQIPLEKGSLCFTYCQVPIIYKLAQQRRIEILLEDGNTINIAGQYLDLNQSKQIFNRTNEILQLKVYVKSTDLK